MLFIVCPLLGTHVCGVAAAKRNEDGGLACVEWGDGTRNIGGISVEQKHDSRGMFVDGGAGPCGRTPIAIIVH